MRSKIQSESTLENINPCLYCNWITTIIKIETDEITNEQGYEIHHLGDKRIMIQDEYVVKVDGEIVPDCVILATNGTMSEWHYAINFAGMRFPNFDDFTHVGSDDKEHYQIESPDLCCFQVFKKFDHLKKEFTNEDIVFEQFQDGWKCFPYACDMSVYVKTKYDIFHAFYHTLRLEESLTYQLIENFMIPKFTCKGEEVIPKPMSMENHWISKLRKIKNIFVPMKLKNEPEQIALDADPDWFTSEDVEIKRNEERNGVLDVREEIWQVGSFQGLVPSERYRVSYMTRCWKCQADNIEGICECDEMIAVGDRRVEKPEWIARMNWMKWPVASWRAQFPVARTFQCMIYDCDEKNVEMWLKNFKIVDRALFRMNMHWEFFSVESLKRILEKLEFLQLHGLFVRKEIMHHLVGIIMFEESEMAECESSVEDYCTLLNLEAQRLGKRTKFEDVEDRGTIPLLDFGSIVKCIDKDERFLVKITFWDDEINKFVVYHSGRSKAIARQLAAKELLKLIVNI